MAAILSTSQTAIPVYIVGPDGEAVNLRLLLSGNPATGGGGSSAADMDVNGDPVPTYKAHSYTYDDSGNLSTDSVTNGTNTWTRTYTYTPSGPASDSGWVKQ